MPMFRRITVDGYDAGLEPVSHPIWKARVRSFVKVLSKLGPKPVPVEILLDCLEKECGWTRRTCQHVLGAAEEFGEAVEKDLCWRRP